MVRVDTANLFLFFSWHVFHAISASGLPSGGTGHVLVQRSKPLPGAPSKLHEIKIAKHRNSSQEHEIHFENIVQATRKRSRRSINPDYSPTISEMHLNDSHHMAYVHWSGDNHETVVVLTREPTMTSSSNSAVWISRDYAKTFLNYTTRFNLFNGNAAQISLFYSSLVDKTKYIFVDRRHKYIFTTTDDCQTFRRKAVAFTPDEISFHVSDPNVVLVYDRTSSIKRLYVSQDFGLTWRLKDEHVRSYYWGVPQFENASTLFIERQELSGGKSVVVKTLYFTNSAVSLISGVNDFEVIDGYMFATKSAGRSGGLTLMVSVNRSAFHAAIIPSKQPSLDFLVCDVSENQVFLAVSHSMSTTHLYISDASGLKYSLSLPRVLYFSVKTGSPWLRRYIDHSFVDLYKVDSLRGVYIASQLTAGAVRHRHLISLITFDKGGEWRLIESPKIDMDDHPINCLLPNCSLHVSQEFGTHYPYTHYTPLLSSSSAPGIALAMGTIGNSLKLHADVFLSSNGGLTWHEVLKGSFYYNMGDHGGIIIAVPRGTPTNLIYYSWNEGETWMTKQFLTGQRMNVYGLLTEPGEQSTKFTIFGSHLKKHEWTIVHIDLRPTLGNPCTPQDYKQWIPSDERNSSFCLMGKKSTYERRIAHAHCFNGYNYDRPIQQQNCPCLREDFECDVGYKLVAGTSCMWDTSNGLTPTASPSTCPPGTFYTRTKGYRKVVGDTCVGGQEDVYGQSKVSCPVASLPEFILYAQRSAIKRLTLGDYRETTLPLTGLQQTIAVDFDYKENCVYWADISLDTISRAFLNGSGIVQTLHRSMQQVEGLALDWLGNNIFWIDANARKIEVSRKDGHYRKVLYTDKLDRPRALALDPMKGYMYWTDWGSKALIVRAHMSGANRTDIITTNLRWPNGITLDLYANKVYWADAGRDRIERADLDGSHREVVTSRGLPHPYSISIYHQFMYWDDWSTRSIIRALKRDGSARTVVKAGLVGVMDLKVFHRDIQQGHNNCSINSPCTFLCLAAPTRPFFQCACPDNMVMGVMGVKTCECKGSEVLVNGECHTLSGSCSPGQYKCNNNKCVPVSWRCDHEDDCGDGSDETGCAFTTCSPTDFKCSSGLCIRRTWVCDHDNDCGDMSDERNCTFPTCASTAFTCKNHRCISRRWVCDFDNDCRDGSDELGCTSAPTTGSPAPGNCNQTQFSCRNGRCIPRAWYCDSDNDCGDDSDEPIGCHRKHTCSSRQFTCSNGRCISMRWRCDLDNDCLDNSDEMGCTNSSVVPTTAPHSTTPRSCRSWEFRCGNGRCVSHSQCRDRINDCGDNTDETKCIYGKTTTGPCWDFMCRNGFCIWNNKTCDTVNDCGDYSDEIGCTVKPPTTAAPPTTRAVVTCPFAWTKCPRGLCVSNSWLCDGVLNCPSGWDELPMHCKSIPSPPTTCAFGHYECTNGKCIPHNQFCDGRVDCSDGSDETTCSGPTVEPMSCLNQDLFLCDGNHLCLSSAKMRCNNQSDCKDGTDERDCDKKLIVGNMACKVSNISLTITWTPSAYIPTWMGIKGHNISYRKVHRVGEYDMTSDGSEADLNGNNTSYVLTGLKPCTEYVLTVRVIGSQYVGPPAEPIKVKTPTVDIGAPQDITSFIINNSTLLIHWTPSPRSTCHPVTNFRITYSRSSWKSPKKVMTSNVYETMLSELQPFVIYTIQIQGYNKDDGYGDKSAPYTATINYSNPPSHRQQSSPRKSRNVLAWAIPVSLVGVLLLALLGYFVRKSRRLQSSMYALLTTNSDTEGEVTFHADDDDPMIRGFSDDELLVTA